MDFHWPGTLPEFPVDLTLAYKPQCRPGSLVATDSPSYPTEYTIVSSIGSTWYLEFPADPTPASGPAADEAHWWLQIHLMKGVRIYHSEFHQCHSVPPILFYNIMGTVAMTLIQCTFIFYLVVFISTFLDCLVFDIVDFLLHYGNGLYTFSF